MKNNIPLDEHIKNKLGNYQPDVPSHIWENIMAGKDKKRPVGFWSNGSKKYGFLILAVILSAGALVVYKNMVVKNEAKNLTSTKVIENDYSQSNNKTQIGEERTVEQIPQTTENDLKPTTSESVSPFPATHKSSAAIRNRKETVQPAGVVQDANSSPARKLKNKFFTKGKTSMSYSSAQETSENLPVDNYENASLTEDDGLLKKSFLDFTRLQSKARKELSVTKINVPCVGIPCPGAGKKGSGRKYIEVYGGPDYAFRSMEDTGNSVYLQKRKESAKFSSAFSTGLRYTRLFNNGMSFRTGINYSQINEKFQYQQGNIIQVVYMTNSNGDTTGSFTTSNTRYKTTQNVFRTIDVPLLIGYEAGGANLRVNFNAGAMINLYSWQKGDVLDTAYQPVSITTGKASSPYQFKNNAGIGFLAGVSVYYKIKPRLYILAEPYFRYNFSPASKAELTLKQKYSTSGVRFGLRLDL